MKTTIQLTVIISLAIFSLSSCGEKPEAKNPLGEPDIIPIKVTSISALDVPDFISATGLLSTEDETNYSFKIGGVISKVLVNEGQFFKKGQLLALLNATEIAAGLAQNSLAVDKSERDYQRAINLYKDSVFTLEQLQNTKTALDVAKKASEATAFNERYSRIYANADGFVAKKVAHEGEVVNGGMPVLITNTIEKRNSFLLKVGVTDKQWATIKLGQNAKVTLDGYPDKTFEATVFRKSQAADPQLGSFQVELRLSLNGTVAAVGMFGKAKIAVGQEKNVIVVPYGALVEPDGYSAFIFTPNGTNRVKKVPVNIVKFDNNNVYLKKDLQGVEQIVISNSAYLNKQSIVKIIR